MLSEVKSTISEDRREEVTLPVLRRAKLGDRAVKVLQESTKNNPYTVILTEDGKIGWVLADNIW